MDVIKKLKKYFHKHKFVVAMVVVITVALITTLILFLATSTTKTVKQPVKKSTLNSESFPVSASDAKRIEASPSSGPLQYEQVETYYSSGSKIPKFIYVTSEYRDERLIELNDQIVLDLKNTKKIDDNTDAYSINYFNNKTIAINYFKKIGDPNTSDNDKSILKSGYIAKTIFSKNLKQNQMIKISTAKILKTY